MRRRFVGDSFDIVKQSLLRWLSCLGPWATHPMFTEPFSAAEARAFSRLLGVPLVSRAVLAPNVDRSAYFAPARSARTHVFLDPDTGLRMQTFRGAKSSAYLFASEIQGIVAARPGYLTMVFDQGYDRKRPHDEQVYEKLAALRACGLHGTAYLSHVHFLLLSDDVDLILRARRAVLRESHLPAARLARPL